MTMIFQSTLPPSLFSAGVYCRKRALVQLPAIINVEHQHICPSDKEVETRTFLLAGKIQKDVIRTLFTQIVAVLIHRDESVDRALLPHCVPLFLTSYRRSSHHYITSRRRVPCDADCADEKIERHKEYRQQRRACFRSDYSNHTDKNTQQKMRRRF